MIKKSILIYSIFICILASTFAADNSVSCEFVYSNQCTGTSFFAVPSDPTFNDSNGKVLSANTRTIADANYGKVLCCNSPYGEFGVEIKNDMSEQSCGEDIDLFYFTDNTNARIAFTEDRNDIVNYNSNPSDLTFRADDYIRKLCVSVPANMGTFDIVVSDKANYNNIGYDCMFKVSSLTNGVVSSCDAEYNGGNQYLYSVWGRMFESLASLECNSDCTSKLDGRVYAACAQKVSSCSSLKSIGGLCDGALLGSWVEYDTSSEVQCSAPWDIFRDKVFTDEKLDVTVSRETEVDGCDNLISKKFTVLLNNEQVTMSVYICED
jgi:hypothetical protein